MIGSFKIKAIGLASTGNILNPGSSFVPSNVSPYIDIECAGATSAIDTVVLGNNQDAVSFVGAEPVFGFRNFSGYTVDSQNADLANVYLQPDMSSMRMSQSIGTRIECLDKLNYSSDIIRGVDGYRVFSGLIQLAHRVIDGVSTNSITYPGVRAAGTSVEVLTPLLKSINLQIQLQTKDGVDKSTITEIVKSTVAGYVNALGVGRPVILSEIKAISSGVRANH
jgi:hypothetical protein